MTSALDALAENLSVLEPGVLRVYFSVAWGESDFWRGILAGMRRRNPGAWAKAARFSDAGAEAVLTRWVDALPADPGAFLIRAERLRKLGRCGKALALAKRTLRLEPGSPHARALLAKIRLTEAASAGHRGIVRSAREIKAECRAALADARCLWTYNLLELVLCTEGRHEEAYEVLSRLARRHPQSPEILVKQSMQEFGSDFESCEARLKKALALRPGWTVLYAFRGELLRLRGRLDEARDDFDFVVERKPDYDRAYLWRSKIRRARGEFAEALRDVDRALALEPGNSRSHFERFQISLELGAATDALASLQRAEEVESRYPWNGARSEVVTGWRYRRFGLLCRLRRYEDALQCLQAVRREDPKYTWAFGSSRTDGTEARRQLDDAIRRRPANPWFRAWRGQTALAAGDLGRARADLDSALRLDSRPAWFHLWRGELNLRSARIEECLADLRRAARSQDCRPQVEGFRAEAELSRGRWAEALKHSRRAAALAPSGVWALLSMARALRGLNRPGPAREAVERARRLAPGDSGVLSLIREFDMGESFFPFDIISRDAPSPGPEVEVGALSKLYDRETKALKGELRRASKAALARTHAKRGWVSHCSGQDARALLDLNQAVELDPANAVYRVWRGRVLRAQRRWEAARRDFTAAIEREPRAASAYAERSRVQEKLGNGAEALADDLAAAGLGAPDVDRPES